jgi:glycosyltransferase involved in cell wall biosynthesis
VSLTRFRTEHAPSSRRSKSRVLFLVENVPLELDSRVRRQTRTLFDEGHEVTVICPGEKGQPRHEQIDGIHVFRYRKPALGSGLLGHLVEYVASVLWQLALTMRVFSGRGFDIIHFANPPDILWLIAAPYRLVGKRIVYDQHDLVPELFDVRFGRRFGAFRRLVSLCEVMSYRTADHVIAINDTCRLIAIRRGHMAEADVTIVRNGPRLAIDFPPVEPDSTVRQLGRIVVGYLGIMNRQDDLDVFLAMARSVRADHGRDDIGFVMVGDGDDFSRLTQLRDRLGLSTVVRMTGRVPWDQVLSTLTACDICVQPDLPTVLNSKLTMNKLMEYMAFGKPIVAFDMPETRMSGGESGVYVTQFDGAGLAEAVVELADNPSRREQLGRAGRRRIEEELGWEHQSRHLLAVYERLSTSSRHAGSLSREPA